MKRRKQALDVTMIPMTPDAVGILLKEALRRGMLAIRTRRLNFTVTEKAGLNGKADAFTDADNAAQDAIVDLIRKTLPGVGVVVEEVKAGSRKPKRTKHILIPCTLKGADVWITVDGMDGTGAFRRKESGGIACMISMSYNGVYVAGFILDVINGELVYYRPDGSKVHWIVPDQEDNPQEVRYEPKPLSESYIYLRDRLDEYSLICQSMFFTREKGGLFSGYNTERGSIGLTFVRLFRGEAGAVLMLPRVVTPWDVGPFVLLRYG
ncbi:MAG TPA: inositol monophosphatase family protein [Patescibacteria group bacterium]|nr:inositol monophosphatase family protein [Patescibacteria group bacterium]